MTETAYKVTPHGVTYYTWCEEHHKVLFTEPLKRNNMANNIPYIYTFVVIISDNYTWSIMELLSVF